jgi:beta-phosphoglucomutase family hydrolase
MTEIGLPDGIRACLFDLDGVLTDTAAVHSKAWAEMFDGYLRERSRKTGEPFVAFDPAADYESFVDGKPREAGVRDFLASRGITLPEGSPEDPADAQTVTSLGARKNDIVQRRIDQDGVHVFEGSQRFLEATVKAGLRRAVVSSSANTERVLKVTGLDVFIEERVDAITAKDQHLQGKPAPDTYLAGASALGVTPAEAAVFEDALAGVEAGRAGGFGWVVGIDRVGHGPALKAHGADVVVTDLAQLLKGQAGT